MAENALSQLIERVTKDLRAIQEELGSAALSSTPDQQRQQVMDELLNLELVQDFKTAVDHMRHLLWSYVESQASRSPQEFANAIQAVRMQRVTEMLRVLKPSVEEANISGMPGAQSFFDEIQAIANQTVDRHNQRDISGRHP